MIFILKKPMDVGVHMLFMRFPIDVIFLDQDRRIIDTATLKPWTGHRRMKGVKYLIEMKQGSVERTGMNAGDMLDFEDA